MAKLLVETLSAIKNAEGRSKKEIVRRPVSKLLLDVLKIAKREGYLGEITEYKDVRGGEVKVNLIGAINNIGVISPNFSVSYHNLEKFEKRFLPAKDFGRLILTTPKGVMTHIDARDKKVGGKLLAFVY
jgi:small subunit ribosomal protein S8